MKRSCLAISWLLFCAGLVIAQKATAEPDYYPLGYSLDIWTGEVTAFDNNLRTLTLTFLAGEKVKTFVASIPDAPYEWRHDGRNFRVVDFPFDKKSSVQIFKYVMNSGVYVLPPEQRMTGTPLQKRPNPPPSDVINDLSPFMGRTVTVYYTTRERPVSGGKEEYNDVWRIRVLPAKKKN